MSELTELSASAIVERLASGDLTAVDVTRAHLDRIQQHDGDLNAFRTVVAEQALERAASLDAHRTGGQTLGPLHGLPIALKDNLCTRGIPTTASSRILERLYSAVHRHVCCPTRGRRRHRPRQDEPRRVRHGVVHRELGIRAVAQSLRDRSRTGRIERRLRRRRRGSPGARGSGLRYRRIHSPARGADRDRRAEAHLRTSVALRTARVRFVARSDRPAHEDGCRCSVAPRSDGGCGSPRCDRRPRAGVALSRRAHRRGGRPAHRRSAARHR